MSWYKASPSSITVEILSIEWDSTDPAVHRDGARGSVAGNAHAACGYSLGLERRVHAIRFGSGDQEPSGGLSVGEHQLLRKRQLAPVHVRCERRVVALGAAGDDSGTSEVEDARQQLRGRGVDGRCEARRRQHAAEVTEKAETGHVGAGRGSYGDRGPGGTIVERRHRLDG